MSEPVTVWQILTVIIFPIFGVSFWLLYNRQNKTDDNQTAALNGAMKNASKVADGLWESTNKTRDDLAAFQTEAERRYAKVEDVQVLGRRVERHLERIEDKLDHLSGSGPMPKARGDQQ